MGAAVDVVPDDAGDRTTVGAKTEVDPCHVLTCSKVDDRFVRGRNAVRVICWDVVLGDLGSVGADFIFVGGLVIKDVDAVGIGCGE